MRSVEQDTDAKFSFLQTIPKIIVTRISPNKRTLTLSVLYRLQSASVIWLGCITRCRF